MKGTPTRSRREAHRGAALKAMGVRAWISQRTAAAEKAREERQAKREEERSQKQLAADKMRHKAVVPEHRVVPLPAGPSRDRRLAGKKRIRARREATRAAKA